MLGALASYGLGAGLGYDRWLGERWDRVENWLGPASYVVIALLVVGVIVLAVRRRRSSAPDR